MNAWDGHIKKITDKLPEICKIKDLVSVGIFASASEASQHKKKGNVPIYFQVGTRGRILFMREDVVQWFKERIHDSKKA